MPGDKRIGIISPDTIIGANLNNVGMFKNQVDMRRVFHLGDNIKPILVPCSG